MSFKVIDPTTGRMVREVPVLTPRELDELLTRVDHEQRAWKMAPLDTRSHFATALGDAMRAHRERLAELLTEEMGKSISAARAEVDKCILLCTSAPALAREALADVVLVAADTQPGGATEHVYVRHDPLGTALAIMPWNYPYWQALRFVVPALLAGNGVLLKPASSVAGSALELERCFREASDAIAAQHDAPPVPIHTTCISHESIETLIADDRIQGVTLTGSDRAGREVAALAGKYLRKVVLELGGSDPFIVLDDADVERAAEMAVKGRTVNSGQSCIAAKRFIVCDGVYDRFIGRFTGGMSSLVVGDPRDERTQVGPIATESVRDALAAQVRDSLAKGARALVGGKQPDGAGYFYPPTVLVDIPDDAPAATEELFGPVASVFRVPDITAAIARANRTPFGLGASVWTRNDADAERCIAQLDAGMVFVNDMVVSDPRYPFGGVKQSGVGRELGPAGFREFTNRKTVRVLR